MLTLLALASAGAAPAGCFNGGALVGAQAGFSHIEIKRQAKENAIKKEDVEKYFGKFVDALNALADADIKTRGADGKNADFDGAAAGLKDKKYTIKVDLNGLKSGADADVITAAGRLIEATKTAIESDGFSSADTVVYILAQDATQTFTAAGLRGKEVVTNFLKDEAKKAAITARFNRDQEAKYTSNNGFAGLHVGYLGRVNEKFLVGGLVEGNWVFGQDMKVDSTAEKDTNARFNANLFLRAMFNLTGNFMAGADLGVSFQEIRTLKEVGKTDKESKWFWGPAARLVLGVALTDNILATAHFGGVFPIKQDHFKKDFKAKYSNFHGGVGISYAFGG